MNSNTSDKELCRDETDFMDRFISLSRGISRLEEIGTLKTYPKKTILAKPGDTPDHCYIVKSGRVIAYENSLSGDLRIYNFMEPGSLFLEEFMLFDKTVPIYFATSEESVLYEINKCVMKHAFKHDIDIVLDVCESVSSKFLSSMEQLRLFPAQSSLWKLCSFFLNYAYHYGKPCRYGILLSKKISQQTIANLLGMNRVTITRNVAILEEDGQLVRKNGYFILTDISAFRENMDHISQSQD